MWRWKDSSGARFENSSIQIYLPEFRDELEVGWNICTSDLYCGPGRSMWSFPYTARKAGDHGLSIGALNAVSSLVHWAFIR